MALHVKGLINIQFIVYEDEVYVIEVNPRSSRTIPYISKVTGVPVVDVATKVIMGISIQEQGYCYGLVPEKETIAIKMPVFSFEKITGAEIALGPEMKSTGEVLGISKSFDEAMTRMNSRSFYVFHNTRNQYTKLVTYCINLYFFSC